MELIIGHRYRLDASDGHIGVLLEYGLTAPGETREYVRINCEQCGTEQTCRRDVLYCYADRPLTRKPISKVFTR